VPRLVRFSEGRLCLAQFVISITVATRQLVDKENVLAASKRAGAQ